jgi:hypothetical protein
VYLFNVKALKVLFKDSVWVETKIEKGTCDTSDRALYHFIENAWCYDDAEIFGDYFLEEG